MTPGQSILSLTPQFPLPQALFPKAPHSMSLSLSHGSLTSAVSPGWPSRLLIHMLPRFSLSQVSPMSWLCFLSVIASVSFEGTLSPGPEATIALWKWKRWRLSKGDLHKLRLINFHHGGLPCLTPRIYREWFVEGRAH